MMETPETYEQKVRRFERKMASMTQNSAILEHLREIRKEKDQAMLTYRLDLLISQLSGGAAPRMPKE